MRRAKTLPFAVWLVMFLFLTIFGQGALFLTIHGARVHVYVCVYHDLNS